jgi:hypothetical protein
MDYLQKLIEDIETHFVEGIRECFSKGVDPNRYFRNEPLIFELTSEYTRSPRFKECVKAFVDYGMNLGDKILLSVLLDDAPSLDTLLAKDLPATKKAYTIRCAYTPLYKVTLLHICAEFNHVSCAEILVKHGADINAKAGVDENGLGGQTPIFHTVNQNLNRSADMLRFLLSRSADLKITVAGLLWGKGYTWETLIPSVNPISYAMMGLLPLSRQEGISPSSLSQNRT